MMMSDIEHFAHFFEKCDNFVTYGFAEDLIN